MSVRNRRGTATEFFVAAETGQVLRGARYGVPAPPRAFAVCDPLDCGRAAATAPAAAAVSLSFNPFFPKVFLAAHQGGSVSRFSTESSLALERWDGVTPGEVVAVRWSLSRPSQFFVLDDRNYITVFDLLSNKQPTHFEEFGKLERKERIVSLELAKIEDNTGASGHKGQFFASLAYDDGRTDVHLLAEEFVACSPEDMEESRALLDPKP